ncbi:MAG: response regulator [Spirochaetia bacterium]|nr:response regulator [Spirochaetia bacterium]
MIIDDEPLGAELLKVMIQANYRVEVDVFHQPLSGLARLHFQKYQVICLDYLMPRMTGSVIVQDIRTSMGPNADTPVLMVTARREQLDEMGLQNFRDVFILEKPLEELKFLAQIEALLKR